MPKTYQHPHSSSHTPLTSEASLHASDRMTVQVAQRAGEYSLQRTSPANRSTQGFCRNCRSNVGEFYNSWHKITGSYYVPALAASYRSLLKHAGKQKAASKGTAIEGCIIQPLSCPTTGCNLPIGFTVVDAPTEKRIYLGRDFFKLSRIDLRCELSPGNLISAEPLEDASEFLPVEDHPSPSPTPARLPTVSTKAMEIDSRPPGIHHHQGLHQSHHEEHRAFHRQHQPLQQMEANSKSLPLPSVTHSPNTPLLQSAPHKAISNPPPSQSPSAELVHELQPPIRDAGAGFMNQSHTLPSIVSHPMSIPSPATLINGHHYPRAPQQVQLDAIERLQTQTSQNSGALAAQRRDIRQNEKSLQLVEENLRREFQAQLHRQSTDIRRMDETVGRLYHEMQTTRQVVEGFSREMHAMRGEIQAQGTNAPSGKHISAQDSALELMAHQIATIAQKANEVDTLKLAVEIMKNKIQRLEEGSNLASHPQPVSQDQSAQSTHTPHTTMSYNAAPVAVSHDNTPVHLSPHRSQSHSSIPSSTATLEANQRPESLPSQNGWATVNAGIKRPYPNGVESPREGHIHTFESPKRQRTGTDDFNGGSVASQGASPTQTYEAPVQPQTHTVPSQSHNTTGQILASESQYPVRSPYGTQDDPPSESWRPESQRVVEHRPRGRPRGSGRGGRGRKSTPAQVHPVGTSDWESSSWQGVPDSRMSPEGHYNHITPSGKGIVRRGNGGGGRGGHTPDRAASLGLQGVTASRGTTSPDEFYGSTKKSRSKPVRNADGVLIRKDGRPDMRSQSSAANLRRVHTKKDGNTSGSFQDSGSTTPNTPSPSAQALPELDAASKKHNEIMGRMFPRGMDESRKDHDYARQLFEEDYNYTAHARAKNPSVPRTKSPREMKKEQVEPCRIAESHTPKDGDVDMDRENGKVQTQVEQSNGNDTTIPDAQDREDSAALAAETSTSAS